MTPEREKKLRQVTEHRYFDLTLLLENVHDPHNVSAILRTCDAVGVAEVHVVNTILPWHQKGHKSSASAKQWVKVHFYRELNPCIDYLQAQGFELWGTHLSAASRDLLSLDLKQRVALVFGNEHAGISEELLAFCKGNFTIPMQGMLHSLNVSVSAAVSLYEAFRQRQGTQILQSEYNVHRQKQLLTEWQTHELRRRLK